MIIEALEEMFQAKKEARDEKLEEDQFIDSLEIDDELKDELKRIDKMRIIRKYAKALKDLKRMTERYESMIAEKEEARRKEIHAEIIADSIRKRHEPQAQEAGYKLSWTWINKIVFILTKYERPMKSKEIVERLVACDHCLKHTNDPQKHLSFYLNKAVHYKRILTHKLNGIRGFYYVLPQWMDDGILSNTYQEQIFIYK